MTLKNCDYNFSTLAEVVLEAISHTRTKSDLFSLSDTVLTWVGHKVPKSLSSMEAMKQASKCA